MALVLTAPPYLEALRDKLTVIRAHQLYEPRSMRGDCWELLKRDLVKGDKQSRLKSPCRLRARHVPSTGPI